MTTLMTPGFSAPIFSHKCLSLSNMIDIAATDLETPAHDRWHILTHGHLLVKYVRRRHAYIQIAT